MDLKSFLSNSQHPKRAIEEFQQKHGLSHDSLAHFLPVLKLLDLMDYSRALVYDKLLSEMMDIFSESFTDEIDDEIFNGLLDLLSVKSLERFAFSILSRIQGVSDLCATKLLNFQDFNRLPNNLKRIAWKSGDLGYERLKIEVILVCERFSLNVENDKLLLETLLENSRSLFRRCVGDCTMTLADFVGNDEIVYSKVLSIVRSLYLKDRNYLIAGMRHELVMKLHDIGNTRVVGLDPCYKLAWCLDACIHPSFTISDRQLKELKTFYDSISPLFSQNNPLIGEVALILSHPHTQWLLLHSTVLTLDDLKTRPKIPKDNAIYWLYDFLALSLEAGRMLESQSFVFKLPNPTLLSDLKPFLRKMETLEPISVEFYLDSDCYEPVLRQILLGSIIATHPASFKDEEKLTFLKRTSVILPEYISVSILASMVNFQQRALQEIMATGDEKTSVGFLVYSHASLGKYKAFIADFLAPAFNQNKHDRNLEERFKFIKSLP